jgi:hypothetical protein
MVVAARLEREKSQVATGLADGNSDLAIRN